WLLSRLLNVSVAPPNVNVTFGAEMAEVVVLKSKVPEIENVSPTTVIVASGEKVYWMIPARAAGATRTPTHKAKNATRRTLMGPSNRSAVRRSKFDHANSMPRCGKEEISIR